MTEEKTAYMYSVRKKQFKINFEVCNSWWVTKDNKVYSLQRESQLQDSGSS